MSLIHTLPDSVSFNASQVNATAAANGTGIDSLGYRWATVVIRATTNGTGLVTIGLQDSTDNSTFGATITGSTVAVPISQTNAYFFITIDLAKRNRYLRSVSSAVTATATYDCWIVLHGADYSLSVAAASIARV